MTTRNTQYEDLLARILRDGVHRPDRTGTGTRSLFAQTLRYDLQQGFPLITTKKVFTKAIVHELIWLLSGDTNIKYLQDHGVKIWNEWADEFGDLGPVYGQQWRRWDARADNHDGIDQIQNVIDGIKKDPYGRRHIVTAWNPTDVPVQALPPCHLFFQFYVADGSLSCHILQRSADMFLGVPFNIASYALLTHMIAQQTGLGVGELVWTGNDVHVYDNHVEAVTEQIGRPVMEFPTLTLEPRDSIDDYVFEDVDIWGYRSHGKLTAPVSV